MSKHHKSDLAAIAVILIISLIYWSGVSAVPFHPDESTQMYMAADFKAVFTNPQVLFWRPSSDNDRRMVYREIDPPLTRYLIGLGFAVSGQAALANDWDWSATMQQNMANGSYPSAVQLIVSRMAVASLFPFSLLFAYLIGKKLRGYSFGWLNLGLLAVNAAVLLHTRRAMAESALLAGALFTLWAAVTWDRRRFLIALPAALAFNAKYSTLPLVLIGLAAIFWDFPLKQTSIKNKLIHGFQYTALFISITVLLNPFIWQLPFPALQDALSRRQELIEAQVKDFSLSEGNQVLETFGEKGEAVLAQLFFGPPAIQEANNYARDLEQSSINYLANPLHRLLTGWIGGSFALFTALAGLILWLIWIIRARPISRTAILIFASFLLQLAAIFIMIRLPFQRYYIPLVPYMTMFIAYILDFSLHLIFFRKKEEIKQEIP